MWLLLLWLCAAHAEIFDRVVVVVDAQIILDSDVRLEARLSELDVAASPFWTDPDSSPTQRLIDAAIVREAAGDVQLYQAPREEVSARLEALRGRFPDRASWQAFLGLWGLDEAAMGVVLRRRLLVEHYLNRNVAADPSDISAWLAASHALINQLRPRSRIRVVPQQTSP